MTDHSGRRVALLTIAKDEGSYLAGFLAHHLALGFAPILVAVNRSKDNSPDLMRAITAADSRVRLVDGDAFLAEVAPGQFQRHAYARMIEMVRGELGPEDYVGFLDVDESWLPLDGAMSVQAQLAAWDYPDRIMANWFGLAPREEAFCDPLPGPLVGRLQASLKSISRIGHDADGLNAHCRFLTPPFRDHVSAGLAVKEQGSRLVARPARAGSLVVLHDMYRSRIEYLASLDRGRPSDHEKPFKTNRKGYWLPDEAAARHGVPTLTLDPTEALRALGARAAEIREGFGAEHETWRARRGTLRRAIATAKKYHDRKDVMPGTLAAIFDRLDVAAVAEEARAALRAS